MTVNRLILEFKFYASYIFLHFCCMHFYFYKHKMHFFSTENYNKLSQRNIKETVLYLYL